MWILFTFLKILFCIFKFLITIIIYYIGTYYYILNTNCNLFFFLLRHVGQHLDFANMYLAKI